MPVSGRSRLALYAPFWPVEPAERARAGELAVVLTLATMGLVAGAILGMIAAWVFDAAQSSVPRAVVRAVVCGLAYAVWGAATAW